MGDLMHIEYKLKTCTSHRLIHILRLSSRAQMNAVAFVVGLISLGLVAADVSHLRHQQGQHTFHANNGQAVQQSFNSRGQATYSSSSYNAGNGNSNRYWWMNTETQPFTQQHQPRQQHNTQQNYFSAAGCNGCASRTLSLKHNTQPTDKHQNFAYSQNSFASPRHVPIYNRPRTSVSGSPREVNNFFGQQQQQQSSSCADSNSACVAQKSCNNGFIDQSAENKAVRSPVSVFLLLYTLDIHRSSSVVTFKQPAHDNCLLNGPRIKRLRKGEKIFSFNFALTIKNYSRPRGWKG